MHSLCNASASVGLLNVHPACFFEAYKTRLYATVAPFCSSCLQSGWHGARSDAGLHTKLHRVRHPCDQPSCVHAGRHATWGWVCFCCAAIMSVCHRLALRLAEIDGGGGVILDCTHTQKLTRLSRCLGLMSKPVSIWEDCVLMLS